MAITTSLATCAAVASGFALGASFRIPAEGEGSTNNTTLPRRELEKPTPQSPKAAYEAPAYDEEDTTPPQRRQSSKQSRRRRKTSACAPRGDRPERQCDSDDLIGWEGFSMEEAIAQADEAQKIAMLRTPCEVLADLQRGNARFWMNTATRPEKSAFARRALISKQFPSVAVLGCSDSRVPVEIVFDQGLGDIFVVRVAGNCLDTSTLASLQYAVHHLKVKVVMVMGHEMCGAVKASQLPPEKLEQEPVELESVLKTLKVGLDEEALRHLKDNRSQDREAVTSNVRHQVDRLKRDTGIASKVAKEEVLVVGAFYELSSGIVDFLDAPSMQPNARGRAPAAVPAAVPAPAPQPVDLKLPRAQADPTQYASTSPSPQASSSDASPAVPTEEALPAAPPQLTVPAFLESSPTALQSAPSPTAIPTIVTPGEPAKRRPSAPGAVPVMLGSHGAIQSSMMPMGQQIYAPSSPHRMSWVAPPVPPAHMQPRSLSVPHKVVLAKGASPGRMASQM